MEEISKSVTSISDVLKEWESQKQPSFGELAESIRTTHDYTQTAAIKAVNQYATMRNWLIGCYIVEYEQKGKDRAEYGAQLLSKLEKAVDRKGLNVTLFKNSRLFYTLYPQTINLFSGIRPTVSDELEDKEVLILKTNNLEKHPTLSDELSAAIFNENEKSPTVSDKFTTDAKTLVSKLSFSHIVEIMTVDDPLARFYYETECIKCCWSVRELRRQISTNLYFRSGICKNPKSLLEQTAINSDSNALAIRQPFIFEFLGLQAKEAFSEIDLESALIDHLQEFILELGNGFCFEARQKRFLIDDEYYFADLVFYSRILHCNIIIELKDDEFKHEYLGQLNAYVSYYKENEMHQGDNPPVGILLCTRKGKKMVEYAIAGMDNQLFVSTYMLQLPDKSRLEKFLLDEIKIKF